MRQTRQLPDITLVKVGSKKKGNDSASSAQDLWNDLNDFIAEEIPLVKDEDAFLVAKCIASQTIVGVAVLRRTNYDLFDDVISVAYIKVHESARRQGVATLMLSVITGVESDQLLKDLRTTSKSALIRQYQPDVMSLVSTRRLILTAGNQKESVAPIYLTMHIPFNIAAFKLAKKAGCIPIGICHMTHPECEPKLVMLRLISVTPPDGRINAAEVNKITRQCRDTLDRLVGLSSCSPLRDLPSKLISGVCALASDVLDANRDDNAPMPLSASMLEFFFDSFDIERLARFIIFGGHKLSSISLAGDLWPLLAFLYFRGHFQALPADKDMPRIEKVTLAPFQRAILVGLGFQRKTADQLGADLELNKEQLEVQFKLCLRNFQTYLTALLSRRASQVLHSASSVATAAGVLEHGCVDA